MPCLLSARPAHSFRRDQVPQLGGIDEHADAPRPHVARQLSGGKPAPDGPLVDLSRHRGGFDADQSQPVAGYPAIPDISGHFLIRSRDDGRPSAVLYTPATTPARGGCYVIQDDRD